MEVCARLPNCWWLIGNHHHHLVVTLRITALYWSKYSFVSFEDDRLMSRSSHSHRTMSRENAGVCGNIRKAAEKIFPVCCLYTVVLATQRMSYCIAINNGQMHIERVLKG